LPQALTDQSVAHEPEEPNTVVDFTLTDEQKAIREMAHDFAAKEIRPVAWEYDKDGAWPEEVLRKAWETGLMNTHVPEEYGGPGGSYLDGCIIEEEPRGAVPGSRRRSAPTAWPPRRSRWPARTSSSRSTLGCSPRTSSSPPSA
jgi:hypothetical protein